MLYLFAIIIGYLAGSIPSSFLVGKVFGKVDLRKVGSGNLGTTNVIRTLGLKYGLLAYALDMLKGLVPVLLIKHFWGFDYAVWAGVAAIIGHCYSIFLSFQGGKGVAVSSGVLFAIDPIMAVILIAFQLIIAFTTRYMGLASILNALVFPLVAYMKRGVDALLYAAIVITPFVIFQHRMNIKRMLEGTEKKL